METDTHLNHFPSEHGVWIRINYTRSSTSHGPSLYFLSAKLVPLSDTELQPTSVLDWRKISHIVSLGWLELVMEGNWTVSLEGKCMPSPLGRALVGSIIQSHQCRPPTSKTLRRFWSLPRSNSFDQAYNQSKEAIQGSVTGSLANQLTKNWHPRKTWLIKLSSNSTWLLVWSWLFCVQHIPTSGRLWCMFGGSVELRTKSIVY